MVVMEGLESLVDRARGTLTAALAQRRGPAADHDKSGITSPTGTKPAAPQTRDSSLQSPAPAKSEQPRPPGPTHEETNMRGGHYEGVPMQEYLAPSPHTVGVPVPDVHPSTPRRPPVHPRPSTLDRLGIPQHHHQQQQQQRPPPSRNHHHFSKSVSNPHLHPRHLRDYYGSDRQLVRGNSGDRLHHDYGGNQIASPSATLRPPRGASVSADSVRSERSHQVDHRPRSDRRWAEEGRSTSSLGHRRRHSSEERSQRRRRSSSPPTRRRSRSRESERSHHRRQQGEGSRAHAQENHHELFTSSSLVNNSGGTSSLVRPSVYTISGSECPDSRQPQHQLQAQQLQHIRHLQPVQPQQGQETPSSEKLKWQDALRQAISARDIRPIKPLLPTAEEAIDCFGQPQVIALVCGIITAFLMVLALSSSDWLLAVGWRQGLFAHCIGDGAPKPLPFQINAEVGCHTARDEPYIMASAALCVICLLLDVFATLMTGLGLSNNDPAVKTRYYRIAVWVMTVALIAILIALILYPVFFAQELELGNRTLWEFGWAYGVGWGAAIFLFGAVVLLLCDQEEEEIYYKERTIIHAENDSRA